MRWRTLFYGDSFPQLRYTVLILATIVSANDARATNHLKIRTTTSDMSAARTLSSPFARSLTDAPSARDSGDAVTTRDRRQNCGSAELCGTFCCTPLSVAPLPPLPAFDLPMPTSICTPIQQDSRCAPQFQLPPPLPLLPSLTCICTPIGPQQSPMPLDPCCMPQQAPLPLLPPPPPRLTCICTTVQQDPCCGMQQAPPPSPPPLPAMAPACDCLQVTLRIHPSCNCGLQPPIQNQPPLTPPPPPPSPPFPQPPAPPQAAPPICICTPVQQDTCCFAQFVQQAPPPSPPPPAAQPMPICVSCTPVQQDQCCLPASQMVLQQQPLPPPPPQSNCICMPEQNDPCCITFQRAPPLRQPPPTICICTPVQQDACCNLQRVPSLPPSPPPPPRPTCICTPIQQDSCCLLPAGPTPPSPPPQANSPLAPTCICMPVQQDPCCLPLEPSTPQASSPLLAPPSPLPLGIQSVTIQCAPLCGLGGPAGSNFLSNSANLPQPPLPFLRDEPRARRPLVKYNASPRDAPPLTMACSLPADCKCEQDYAPCGGNKCCLRFARHARHGAHLFDAPPKKLAQKI